MTKNKLCEALHPEILFNYFAQGEPRLAIRTGEPLKVVCHIRDEAHRFGITFHRQKRSKDFIHSELEQIEGIGTKSIQTLLRHFRTVEKVRTAPLEEVAGIVGQAKARKIKAYFEQQSKQ